MAVTNGSFSLPTPSRTSEIVNDSRYMSILEYPLTATTLRGTTTLSISGLNVNAIIHQVDIVVSTPFVSDQDQNNISVSGADGTVLMDAEWNDPNTEGVYSSDCYYPITSTVTVTHDLTNMTAGAGLLRLYIHDVTV